MIILESLSPYDVTGAVFKTAAAIWAALHPPHVSCRWFNFPFNSNFFSETQGKLVGDDATSNHSEQYRMDKSYTRVVKWLAEFME